MLDDNTQKHIRFAAIAARELFDAWRVAAPSPHMTTVSHVLASINRAAQALEQAASAVEAMARSHTKESK